MKLIEADWTEVRRFRPKLCSACTSFLRLRGEVSVVISGLHPPCSLPCLQLDFQLYRVTI